MTKFLSVVKREYLTRVRTKMFVVFTILGPLMVLLFTVVPALIATIKVNATRIAVIDQTEGGRMYERVRDSILRERDDEGGKPTDAAAQGNANAGPLGQGGQRLPPGMGGNFVVERVQLDGRSVEEVSRELSERVRRDELDGYLILPPNILQDGEVQYFARNVGDEFTREQLRNRISRAVRDQRMDDEKISPELIERLNKPVNMTARNSESGKQESGGGFFFVFIIGFLIYIMIIMYGQVILAAVVEEKETRIAEMLFSSVRSFPLLLGKLIGVSLVALTQFAIWALAFGAFALYGVGMLSARGVNVTPPSVPPLFFLYFFLFFILGYFVYATLYALVGSVVTTTQEGGQLAMPILFLLIIGFYFTFPVIRSPNSGLAFWVSMFPFFSPITMIVRIVTQTPPFWQILLSLAIGFGTVVLLMWLAARIYRTGMLMYGKRATIPEILRWMRQA
ncbi:MAG TPA: ABC transporter permease [Pyrinomonadaceae bacterium]|nr:ABC transporter permease [Pyrinomonadaceae bacterium]